MFKNLMFSLIATAAISTAASADAYRLHVLECRPAHVHPDQGTFVRIDVQLDRGNGPRPMVVRSVRAPMVAEISEQTFAGPLLVATYNVSRVEGGAVGAPQVYRGKGFDLEVQMSVAPDTFRHPAHLVAEAQGRRLSEELSCAFLR